MDVEGDRPASSRTPLGTAVMLRASDMSARYPYPDLCALTVSDGRIALYQYKRPFGVLEQDSKGAFSHTWWAL